MIRSPGAVALYLLLAAPASAAVSPCPPQLSVSQSAMAPPGFTAYQDGNPPRPGAVMARFPLQNIMVSEGPPEQSGWLVPDQDDPQQETWNIKADEDQHPWIACTYAGTAVFLARPVPPGISVCAWRHSNRLPPMVSCH